MTNDPMTEWVLRDEILAAFHRWPLIVIYALAGAIIAMALTFLWPAPYRANIEISVELNPYRALDDPYLPEFSGAEFRNVDDYKHWQMLQLAILVKSDAYLSETLNRLREDDPYWVEVDHQQLRDMLKAEWRNAGIWLLSAQVDNEEHAAQAVEIWRDVIQELTKESVGKSQELFDLELELRSLRDQILELQINTSILEESLDSLEKYKMEMANLDQEAGLPDHVLQALNGLREQFAIVYPQSALASLDFPGDNAPVSDYLVWIDQLSRLVKEQINLNQAVEDLLDEQYSNASLTWEAALQDGQGLAATLTIQDRNKTSPAVRQIRPYGLAGLAGLTIGLLLYILVTLFQISRRSYR